MDLGLTNKNVIITGASKGIGRASALEFAREGANVAICARSEAALFQTRDEIAALGVKAVALTCDVGDGEALAAFLEQANSELGGVDILVNNPSGFGLTDDEAAWEVSWNVDVLATVRATRQVIPWMEARGSGSIIHISSIAALEAGSPPAYSSVKAALVTHAKTMAAALAPKGIRVNCILPGSIDFADGFWDQVKTQNREMYDGTLATIPSGRFGRPEEVANAVVFLSSARASWISGANVLVDGVQHKGIF